MKPKKENFTVMGSTPGDGGAVCARGFKDAFVTYSANAYEVTKKSIIDSLKEQKVKIKIISKYQAIIGDYHIKKIGNPPNIHAFIR